MNTFTTADIKNLHPVFSEMGSDLNLPENLSGEEQLRFMRGVLRRQPNNLRRHVQYIFLLVRQQKKDALAIKSALLDLFIVLGEGGQPLRERMLQVAKPYLTAADAVYFEQHMQSGLTEKSRVYGKVYSFMTLALSGNGQAIVRQKEEPVKKDFSLFDEAVSMLEQGDVDEARQILERAIKLQPDEEKIAEELLAIYQSQRDHEALAGIRQWFLENDLALPACWPLM